MIRALRTASLGMNAQSLKLDNIANNMANSNTTGFKRSTIEFQDLFYQTFRPAGVTDQLNTELPTELQIGHGNRPVATIKNFSQGNVRNTGNTLYDFGKSRFAKYREKSAAQNADTLKILIGDQMTKATPDCDY